MPNRLRVVGWNVQPVLMVDDGNNLTPVNVSAETIPAAHWDAFKAGGDEEALQRIREQVDDLDGEA